MPAKGMVEIPARGSVDAVVERLTGLLVQKGIKLFALIDHGGEAERAGMKMPATKLLIFGNPQAGTPLMLAAPSIAIDLPLKILVAENNQGKTSISYNASEYLSERHNLPDELLANIEVIAALASRAAE